MATLKSQRSPRVVGAKVVHDEDQDEYLIMLHLSDYNDLLGPHTFRTRGAAEHFLHRHDDFHKRTAESFGSDWVYLPKLEAR